MTETPTPGTGRRGERKVRAWKEDGTPAILDYITIGAEPMTESPTPGTGGDAGTDRETIKEAMAIVRMQIYAVSTMDEEERRIATPQNQSVWIVRELDKAGLLHRATPAAEPGMVTVPVDTLQALIEWTDYADNPFDNSTETEAWFWLDRARDDVRDMIAAADPAPGEGA
jgi:hypothetical protein